MKKTKFPLTAIASTLVIGTFIRKRGGDYAAKVVASGPNGVVIEYLHDGVRYHMRRDTEVVLIRPEGGFADIHASTVTLTIVVPEAHENRVLDWAQTRGYEIQ